MLILLIGLCSYFPQRKWANLFKNDTLQAVLRLPGFEESRLVRAAEQARPYEMLSRMKRDLGSELAWLELEQRAASPLSSSERVSRKIAMVDNHSDIYNHQLDYYPNQLIYLLLTTNTKAYRLAELKLRSGLIFYSLGSAGATVAQFLLPVAFVGAEYELYGWNYLGVLGKYLGQLLVARAPLSHVNTIDYDLSSRIFPTLTQCMRRSNAITGNEDVVVVNCYVGANEICAKLFALIWWLVVVNIVLELWSLLMISFSGLHFELTSCLFGFRYWPAARDQAYAIATFRHRRAALARDLRRAAELRDQLAKSSRANNLLECQIARSPLGKLELNKLGAHEAKHLEAGLKHKAKLSKYSHDEQEEEEEDDDDSLRHGDSAKTLVWLCLTGLGSALKRPLETIVDWLTLKRRRKFGREPSKDINIFYLLYLLYLRLGSSRSKVEEVIWMTSVALENYLVDLEANSGAQARAEFASPSLPSTDAAESAAGELAKQAPVEQTCKGHKQSAPGQEAGRLGDH